MASLWYDFSDLERPFIKIQSEIPYGRFQKSELKKACMISYANNQAKFTETRLLLQTSQSSFHLGIFCRNEGNFREKMIVSVNSEF